MLEEVSKSKINFRAEPRIISALSVGGFKSINDKQTIEIRPLTILSGANSSGKSSIIQPLLLLKQTLESTYATRSLKIDGPNVRFTASNQFLSHRGKDGSTEPVVIGLVTTIAAKPDLNLELRFDREDSSTALETVQMSYTNDNSDQLTTLYPQMNSETVREIIDGSSDLDEESDFRIIHDRCFLTPAQINRETGRVRPYVPSAIVAFSQKISDLIHIPGVRGNPGRDYPLTAIGPTFPGTFEVYTGSVIWEWQQNEPSKIQSLQQNLTSLQLGTSEIQVRRISEVAIELQVSRLPHSNSAKNGSKNIKQDMVSLADVGLGVSQMLPILVALQIAKPGQLVYIEQPELHLHPKAQVALAQLLANAAKRKVRVVIETHSDLLLLNIQTLVAEGNLSPDLVKLHWFERDKHGSTKVTSADLDGKGSFGDWPEDFGKIVLDTQSDYLDAITLYKQKDRDARQNLERSPTNN